MNQKQKYLISNLYYSIPKKRLQKYKQLKK